MPMMIIVMFIVDSVSFEYCRTKTDCETTVVIRWMESGKELFGFLKLG